MVAIIYVGGTGPVTLPTLPADPVVRIAADGGLDLAVALGAVVDLVVGDLDSVLPGALDDARSRGVEVRRAPEDKDETDLELAIASAEKLDISALTVIGGGGGRLDHLLGVLAALAGAARRGIDISAYPGDDLVWFVGPGTRVELSDVAGRTVSLVPLGGPATQVRAVGLTWPLSDATLDPFEAIGVSNRAESPEVTVEVGGGVVAVIVPGLDHESRPGDDAAFPAGDPPVSTSPHAVFRRVSTSNTVPPGEHR